MTKRKKDNTIQVETHRVYRIDQNKIREWLGIPPTQAITLFHQPCGSSDYLIVETDEIADFELTEKAKK